MVQSELKSIEAKKAAKRNIKNAFNWIVGGYENSVSDGELSEMPSAQEIFDTVFLEAWNSTYDEGMASAKPCKQMKQIGKQNAKLLVLSLMKHEGYDVSGINYEEPEKEEPKGQVHDMSKAGTPTKLYKEKFGTMPTQDFKAKFGYFNKNEYAKWLLKAVK